MLEIANNNGERLLRLINDTLDVEKIESGTMQLDIQPINLPKLLTRVIEENRGYGVASGVTFVLDSPIDDLQIIGLLLYMVYGSGAAQRARDAA